MGRTSDARERLVTAMAALVHRRGYLAVGVDDVCRAAGVRKGSFYYFFKSKRDLMLAALNRQWRLSGEHVAGVAFAADRPPLERIERLIARVGELEASNKARSGHVLGCPFGNLAAEVGASEPALTGRANEAFCGFAALIESALQDARRSGDLGRDVDVTQAAEAIVAYFEGVMLLAKTRNDPSLIRRLAPRALDLVSGAAGRSKPAAKRRRRASARGSRRRS